MWSKRQQAYLYAQMEHVTWNKVGQYTKLYQPEGLARARLFRARFSQVSLSGISTLKALSSQCSFLKVKQLYNTAVCLFPSAVRYGTSKQVPFIVTS